MTATARNGHLQADDVKAAARGQWPRILAAVAGVDAQVLDGQHHPCPKCGGRDRFRLIDSQTGQLVCNQCLSPTDGLGAVQWALGCDFRTALRLVGDYLGLSNGKPAASLTIIERIARLKRVPVESLKAFGAVEDVRPTREHGDVKVCRVPMYGPDGCRCSYFDLADVDDKLRKGMAAPGKPVGVFLKGGRSPKPGETVALVEGPKDPAALDGLGFNAVGLPTSELKADFVRLFEGVHVVIVPDRDVKGEGGAKRTAGRLAGVAASVKIATLPAELKPARGDDVRDVLARQNGEALLRRAIDDAREWLPDHEDENALSIASAEGQTDLANCRRLARKHGDSIRFVHPWGRWLVWDGIRWRPDDTGEFERLAKSVSDDLWTAARLRGSDAGLALAKRSASGPGLAAMMRLARSEPGLAVLPEELDADAWLLNCANGTVDLRTGELREHRRDDLLTKLCPTPFNPESGSYLWDRFLEDVFEDAELIAYMQRFCGWCLTGDVSEQVLLILWGDGANGKSTFINAFMRTLGDDYAMQAQPDLLLARRNERHPTELADLYGKRFVACVETGEDRRLNEALVKQLSGGERVRARRMREDFWEFDPTHKAIICTNHKPSIRGTDRAMWRRLRLVPFTQHFDDERRDKQLGEKLRAEAEGILAWAVRGCLEWQAHGLGTAAAVDQATANYRTESDSVAMFLAECTFEAPDAIARASGLFEAFEKWCDETGNPRAKQRAFGKVMSARGYERFTNNGTCYRGIGLRD